MTSRRSFLSATVALAIGRSRTHAQSQVAKSEVRRPVSPLAVRTLDGRSLKVSEMWDKVVVVDFMTTGCPTCKVASGGLQNLHRDLWSKGLVVVAVALDVDAPAALKRYAQEHQLTFPLAVAERADVLAFLRSPADRPLMVPTIAVLDRRGRLCQVEVGWKGEEALRARLLPLLAE